MIKRSLLLGEDYGATEIGNSKRSREKSIHNGGSTYLLHGAESFLSS